MTSEWSAVGSCALPFDRDLRQKIIDPDQQPEISNRGLLVAKRSRDCCLPRTRRAVQDHDSGTFVHHGMVPGRITAAHTEVPIGAPP